jgi:hypothetical protein
MIYNIVGEEPDPELQKNDAARQESSLVPVPRLDSEGVLESAAGCSSLLPPFLPGDIST